MNIIKAFINILAYQNNTPGVISPLGELSTWSKTYSLEKGYYQDATVPGYSLTTFKAIDSLTNTEFVLSVSQVRQILEISAAFVTYASSNTRPYDPIDFKNTILTSFFGRISDLNFGDFVDNGSLALPEWISWTSTEHGGDYIKIWMADQAFQIQYEDNLIRVVPPLNNLDSFFQGFNVVTQALNAVTMPVLADKIQAAKNGHPESYTRVLTFDFVNRLNPLQKTPSNWGVLIYGYTGDNIDAIKDAIVDFVLLNSSHTRTEWEEILPDLFKRTEFSILPRWDLKSIDDLTDLAGLYSSLVNPIECVAFAKDAIDYYPDSFIDAHIEMFPYDYKAIMLVAVSGDNTVPGTSSLKEIFPDYIPVPSTSVDFGRMSLKTQNWLLFLMPLLIAAETVTAFSSIPVTMRKQTKGGILYVSAIYEGVNYLVAARSNGIYA